MARKYLGRLAGKTATGSLSTTPAETVTPYRAQPAGTKFRARGEPATADMYNRPLTALQQNIEDVLAVMDAPTVVNAMMVAASNGSPSFGNAGLTDLHQYEEAVCLAANGGGSPPTSIPAWVYVGLHASQVGRFVRLYRYPGFTPDEYLTEENPTAAANLLTVRPNDVWTLDNPHVSFFPPQQYLSHSPLAPVTCIPPPWQLTTFDAPVGTAVASWETDGFILSSSGASLEEMFARPGCFVRVDGGENAGYYRLVGMSRREAGASKAVLSTAGLHRVTVADASAFTAGGLVRWSNSSDPLEAAQYAYVAFIDGLDLYLTDLPGEEDYPVVPGVPSGKIDPSSAYTGISQFGSIGLFEQERPTTSTNASLRVGAALRLWDGSAASNVTDIRPSGEPIVFDTNPSTMGAITAFAPLGFLVSPYLVCEHTVMQGDYLVEYKTLTTVREKLTGFGASPSRITQNSDAELGFSPADQQRLKAFARYVKTGDDAARPTGSNSGLASSARRLLPNDAFTGTAQILGENQWLLQFDNSDIADSMAVGSSLSLVHPDTGGTTTCIITAASDVWVAVKDVVQPWTEAEWAGAWDAPIEVNSHVPGSGGTYVVAVASAPFLRDHLGNPLLPSTGLDAAYRADYAAAPSGRGAQFGRFIRLRSGEPITTISTLPTPSPAFVGPHIQMIGNDGVDTESLLEWRDLGDSKRAGIVIVDGAIAFLDTNAGTPIPLSEADATVITPALPQSVVGALNELATEEALLQMEVGALQDDLADIMANAVLEECAPTLAGVSTLSIGAGTLLVNGVRMAFAGQEVPAPLLNSNAFCYWSASEYALQPLAPFVLDVQPPEDGDIPVAWVSCAGGEFTNLVDLRLTPHGLDRRVDLTVGGPNGAFPYLGAAVAFVNAFASPGLTGQTNRSWRILVVGRCAAPEPNTIQFVAGDVVIEGLPGAAAVRWSGDKALFDLNGQSNLVFRDLTLTYDTTGAAELADLVRVAFDDTSPAGPSHILLDNVRIQATTVNRLHGYVRASGGGNWFRSRIVNCDWGDATEFGIYCKADGLEVTNSHIWGSNLAVGISQNTPTGGIAGVHLNVASATMPCLLTNTLVAGWTNYGVYAEGGGAPVVLRDCTVDRVWKSGATPSLVVGVCFASSTVRCGLFGGHVGPNVTAPGVALIGISWGGTRGHVMNVDVRITSATTPPASASQGLTIESSANFSIVDGNQTNGCVLNVLNTNSSIGGLNRNDAP